MWTLLKFYFNKQVQTTLDFKVAIVWEFEVTWKLVNNLIIRCTKFDINTNTIFELSHTQPYFCAKRSATWLIPAYSWYPLLKRVCTACPCDVINFIPTPLSYFPNMTPKCVTYWLVMYASGCWYRHQKVACTNADRRTVYTRWSKAEWLSQKSASNKWDHWQWGLVTHW